MCKNISSAKQISILGVFVVLLTVFCLSDMADARSSSGGRSFGGSSSSRSGGFGSSPSKSFGSPSSPSLPPPPPPSSGRSFSPSSPFSGSGGSSFLRGVGGGIVGGLIGNMLFGRSGYSGHGGGVGGVGGSGIGLFELLILGGIGFFLYKRFIKPNMQSKNPMTPPFNPFSTGTSHTPGFQAPPAAPPGFPPASPMDGLSLIRQSEPDFDPEKFKEIAQDVFFKVQAAWMRRDTSPVTGLVGDQLRSEYETQFAEMKQKGLVNRLENIAVRNIEIVDAGMEGQEVYIKILFTANLLDYTVEESTGKVVKGDNTEPVKFEEFWTFARPVNSRLWKLEGIQVK